MDVVWRALFSVFIGKINADVYMRKNYRNGCSPNYKYLPVYLDNVLVISHTPAEVMKQIG